MTSRGLNPNEYSISTCVSCYFGGFGVPTEAALVGPVRKHANYECSQWYDQVPHKIPPGFTG